MAHAKVWQSRCTRRWMWCCLDVHCPASMTFAACDSHAAALMAALSHANHYAPEVSS